MSKVLHLILCGLACVAIACGDGSSNDICPSGQVDCDGNCVNTTYDPTNCGVCGNMCSADSVCNAGSCEGMCGTGTTECDQACVDTELDPSNCGACGTTCNTGEVCSQGGCGTECVGGTTECTGMCVDTDVDFSNCGSCGNTCLKGETCVAGSCSGCPLPRTTCGNACVNTQNDEANCGSCGNACTVGQACTNGACAAAAPLLGFITASYRDTRSDLYLVYENAPGLYRKLNTTTFDTETVTDLHLLSNGNVIFRAAQDTEGLFELYLYDATTTTVSKINSALVTDGGINDFVVSPDESRLLYRGDATTDNVIELYLVVLSTPGTATKVNSTLVTAGNVLDGYAISTDNSTIVYRADGDVDTETDAYVVATSALGTSTRLNPTNGTSNVSQVAVSGDGATVIYRADDAGNGYDSIYAVAVSSPNTATSLDTTNTGINAFALASNTRVVYSAVKSGSRAIYYVDIGNPDVPTKLSATLPPGYSVGSTWTLLAGGSEVVYTSVTGSTDVDRIVRVALASPGVATTLSDPAETDDVQEHIINRAGNALIYLIGDVKGPCGDKCVAGGPAAALVKHVSMTTPGVATTILDSQTDQIFVSNEPSISSDGNKVAFVGYEEFGFNQHLFIYDKTAMGPTYRFQFPLVNPEVDTSTTAPQANAAGDKVYFLADYDTPPNPLTGASTRELYEASTASPGSLTKVNPAIIGESNSIDNWQLAPDGSRLVYLGAHDSTNYELYTVATSNLGTATKLNQTLNAFGRISAFKISADSTRVFFTADVDATGVYELYTVTIANPGVATKLNSALVADGDVNAFTESPDGAFVVYRADQETDGTNEIYHVALSAPGTSTKLSGGQTVSDFRISTSSTFVVFRNDTSVLSHVTIAAPTVQTPLNPALISLQSDYVISNDGLSVYYRGREASGSTQVWRAVIAAPGAHVAISAPMGGGANNAHDFQLTPDQTKLVYRADHVSGRDELYVVTLTTPGVSTRLNTASVGTGLDVYGTYVVTDTSVYYRADIITSSRHELFLSTFASPGVSTPLVAMPSFGDVSGYTVAGGNVFYVADSHASSFEELHSVPLATPLQPTTLTPTVGPTGIVDVDMF